MMMRYTSIFSFIVVALLATLATTPFPVRGQSILGMGGNESGVSDDYTPDDDNGDNDDTVSSKDEITAEAMKNTYSGLFKLQEGLACMVDSDGSYCLLQDIEMVKPIEVGSLAELSNLSEAALDAFCTMKDVSRCSHLLQALLVDVDTPDSRNLPRSTACARHADGSYCLRNFTKMISLPGFDACWIQIANAKCSPECAVTFRKLIDDLGCCAQKATVLFGKIEGIPALEALATCPGLENIHMALQQSCGGESAVGPSHSVEVLTFTLDLPCHFVDYTENIVKTLLIQELAVAGDAQEKHFKNVHLSCDKQFISKQLEFSAHSHLNLHHLPEDETPLHATHVSVRIQAGHLSDDIADILLRKFYAKEPLVFNNLTSAVRALFMDSPTVRVLGTVQRTLSAELVPKMGNSTCNPLLFSDVITQCWSSLQSYLHSSDLDLDWDENYMCNPSSRCAKALAALGTENLVHCTPTAEIGGPLGLAYLSLMCQKNEHNVPCARFLRAPDGMVFCTDLREDLCTRQKACSWNAKEGVCSPILSDDYLDGFCGHCHNYLADMSTMLAPLNQGIPPFSGSTIMYRCLRSGKTYCSDVYAKDARLLLERSDTKGIELKENDLCGIDDRARCHRIGIIMASQRTRLQAESCTLHPFVCLDTFEESLKQELLTEQILHYGCQKDIQGTACIERMNQLTPELLTCYGATLSDEPCSDRCKQMWKQEIDSLGCCLPLIHTFISMLDADQTPMNLRGAYKLVKCIPDISDLLKSNPTCTRPFVSTPLSPTAVSRTIEFNLSCDLFSDELRSTLIENLKLDLSAASGAPLSVIHITNATCERNKISTGHSYSIGSEGNVITDVNDSSHRPRDVVTVSYTVSAETKMESEGNVSALESYMQLHGELMHTAVALSAAIGIVYDVNASHK